MRKVSSKNIQWLEKELPILEQENVVSADTIGSIRSYYYRTQTVSGLHWAVVAFAVLGSLLIGGGIILLFAHNWAALSRPTRAALSFCPVFAGAESPQKSSGSFSPGPEPAPVQTVDPPPICRTVWILPTLVQTGPCAGL